MDKPGDKLPPEDIGSPPEPTESSNSAPNEGTVPATADNESPLSEDSALNFAIDPIPLRRDVVAVDPQKTDIMLGRGRGSSQHPGNQTFHSIVRMNVPRFQQATRSQRTTLATEIVASIKELGGRFIRYNTHLEVWEEVDDRQAREKVDQTFRYHDRQAQKGASQSKVARRKDG